VATQTANVIDLAAYREERARHQASAAAQEVMPPSFPATALPFPLLPPVPGYWLFWVSVLLPQCVAPHGALLDAN
jgi:hypothetical protein